MSQRRPESMRAAMLSAAEARVGSTLAARWHVDRLIAMGGMAAVFAATDLHDGAKVAIKMLFPHFAAVSAIRARFLREGYVANTIDHPGVVSLLADAKGGDGSVFLVMELLAGDSMEAALRDAGGKLAAPFVLAVADQTLSVLAAAHARGIIHRDLKPTNLFITTEGRLKVLDFGLARLDASIGAAPTAAGLVLGTTAYMPPEQAMGLQDQIDARSDLFAMGAVMYRALSGRHIREQQKGDERLMAAMLEEVPSLASVVRDADAGLVSMVDRALAFARQERFPSADAMRTDVRATYARMFGSVKIDSALVATSFTRADPS